MAEPKKQRKFTFQPKKGFKGAAKRAAESGKYGLSTSTSDIVNEALRRFFDAEGWEPTEADE